MGEIKHGIDVFSSLAAPKLALERLPPICDFYDMYTPSLQWTPLYPRQKTLMKIIFLEIDQMNRYDFQVIEGWRESTRNGGPVKIPLDIFDRIEWLKKRGYKHFRENIFCLGRRGSKGFTVSHLIDYKLAQMLSLGNPQRVLHLPDGKEMHVDVMATTFSQAKSALYLDILNTIIECSWFDPWTSSLSETAIKLETAADKVFNEREEMRQIESGIRKNIRRRASLLVEPKAANPDSARGNASIIQAYDEFAYGRDDGLKASSEAIWKALTPSLRQVGKEAMIVVPSTPVSEVGMFYKLFKNAFERDEDGSSKHPDMFCMQAPSWELFTDGQYVPAIGKPLLLPPEQDESFAMEEERDPEKFRVEYRAQFAKSQDAYLNPDMVEKMFNAYPDLQGNANVPARHGRIDRQYVMHCDAGRVNDNFCIAIGHKELCEDGFFHAFIDVQKIFQAKDFPPDEHGVRRINYTVVQKQIIEYLKLFNIVRCTFDQYQSASLIDTLNLERTMGTFLNGSVVIEEDTATEKKNMKRWERFKQALYQGWVHAPFVIDDILGLGEVCMLEKELKFLILKNGKKVDHPETGDVCHDAATEVLTEDGWVRFKDAVMGRRVATYSKDGKIEWQQPIRKIAYEYHGEMYGYSNRLVDFKVTPNHRMLYRLCNHGKMTELMKSPIDGILANRSKFFIPRCGENGNAGALVDLPSGVDFGCFARIVGFWLADGGKIALRRDGVFIISQSKEDGIVYIEAALDGSGFEWSKRECKKSGYQRKVLYEYKVYSKWLADWTLERFFDGAGDLAIPSEIFVEWGKKEQDCFIDGFLHGDGTFSKDKNAYIRVGIKDKGVADAMQAVFMTNGTATSYYDCKTPSGGEFHEICLLGRKESAVERSKVDISRYDGMVYCFEVQNGTLVTRRNGKILISGNCHNDMADCVSTVCVNLLSDQVEALGEGTLLRITGAAQGGYMPEVGMRENLAKEQFHFERSMEFERQMGLTDGWAGRPWGGGL